MCVLTFHHALEMETTVTLRFIGKDPADNMVINFPSSFSITSFRQKITEAIIGLYLYLINIRVLLKNDDNKNKSIQCLNWKG